MGVVLLCIWRFLLVKDLAGEWRSLRSGPGAIVIVAFGINSITFTLGIVETSVTVVLTAVATMPVFAALLSAVLLGERQGWFRWLAIVAAMAGVALVVSDGTNAAGVPGGSAVLGAFYGMLTALGLAVTFTIVRKHPELSVLPAAALGALASGLCGVVLSPGASLTAPSLWSVLCMGGLILPLSFTCLSLAPRYTSSAVVSLIMLLEMVIGPLWVWLGVGERPTGTMIFGAAFVSFVLVCYIARSETEHA